MGVKTYDPKQVIITFGAHIFSGFADGEFITITPTSERFTKMSGADGEVARSKSNDNTHEVTITLLQTSISNQYLSGIVALDRFGNAGKAPLKITDLSGNALFIWNEAWIRQPPDVSFDKEITERAWVFDTGQVVSEVYGGNV
jgi:hypothetical protein